MNRRTSVRAAIVARRAGEIDVGGLVRARRIAIRFDHHMRAPRQMHDRIRAADDILERRIVELRQVADRLQVRREALFHLPHGADERKILRAQVRAQRRADEAARTGDYDKTLSHQSNKNPRTD